MESLWNTYLWWGKSPPKQRGSDWGQEVRIWKRTGTGRDGDPHLGGGLHKYRLCLHENIHIYSVLFPLLLFFSRRMASPLRVFGYVLQNTKINISQQRASLLCSAREQSVLRTLLISLFLSLSRYLFSSPFTFLRYFIENANTSAPGNDQITQEKILLVECKRVF